VSKTYRFLLHHSRHPGVDTTRGCADSPVRGIANWIKKENKQTAFNGREEEEEERRRRRRREV